MALNFRGNASPADKRNNKECAPVMCPEGQCMTVEEEAASRRQELRELGAGTGDACSLGTGRATEEHFRHPT